MQGMDYASAGAYAGKEGLIYYRQAQPLMNRVGMSGNMNAIRHLGTASKYLGVAGYLNAVGTTALDINKCINGQLSNSRLIYNTMSTAAGVYAGLAGGPIAGIAAGVGTWAGEQLYNGYTYGMEQMSIYVTNFENGLKSGWMPGKH